MAAVDGDILDARRQKILASQLKGMGYDASEVQAAIALGPAGVASLRAAPPASYSAAAKISDEASLSPPLPTTTVARTFGGSPLPAAVPQVDLGWLASLASSEPVSSSASSSAPSLPQVDLNWLASLASSGPTSSSGSHLDDVSTLQAVDQQTWQRNRQRLLEMGFSKMQVANALDCSNGDLAIALQVLEQPAPQVSSVPESRHTFVQNKFCIGCAADSTRVDGLTCSAADSHFLCNDCLTSVAKERNSSKNDGLELRCPAPACTCKPWSYSEIAQHLPDQVFGELLSGRERQRERAYKERERQLRAQASRFAAPDYWSSAPSATQLWNVVPVGHAEWSTLAKVVQLPPGASLGGRDQRLPGQHRSFKLGQAWRIENHGLFAKYAAERQRLKNIIATSESQGRRTPKARLRDSFWKALGPLTKGLDQDINELYLTHGTKPEVVQSVISGGLNERYSGGIFGHGTYFAEDVGKNDQYVTEDAKFGDHAELHKELYHRVRHPGKVYYVFLCRVAFGNFCITKDARTDESGASIWSSNQRELAYIPGVAPKEPFHGLLGEVGGAIQRYREFITFHGDRIYPEYLLAYHRS